MPSPGSGRADQRGSAVVDFVLVVVVIVPLFLGVLQVALVMHARNTAASAASEGARLAATADHDLAEGEARTRAQLATALDLETRVVGRPTMLGGAPARQVEVTVAIPALGLWGPAVEVTVRGTAVEEAP